jgi:2-dehydropantoate 2-reductase
VRLVVFGAGAVGGTVGARLVEAGHDVTFVARGAHASAIRTRGLVLETTAGESVLRVPVADGVAELEGDAPDAVLLAVKSQDTAAALDALAARVGSDVPVVCLQNGVENERAALRRFRRVYSVPVMCPTAHIEPGVVQAYSSPVTGILDVGCWPAGVDGVAESLAAAFSGATFESVARPDIARWKWANLLINLSNATEAACGPEARGGRLDELGRAEGEACLGAAGIPFVPAEEDAARRGDLVRMGEIGGRPRGGGSSWQSLARGTGSVEADYLNGEIVLLGRLHGVPTPVNELLQRVANELARDRRPPASLSEEELLAALPRP